MMDTLKSSHRTKKRAQKIADHHNVGRENGPWRVVTVPGKFWEKRHQVHYVYENSRLLNDEDYEDVRGRG